MIFGTIGKRLFRLLLAGCMTWSLAGRCPARQPAGLVYFDLDHLYDTLPARFYDDDDYTPRGRLRWTAERYTHKVRAVAALLDTLGQPLVGLWGVENEAVVRDIVAACREEYSYIHRTLNSLDGMDFALLYHGDRLYPGHVEAGRRYLYVEGLMRRDTVGILLCADAAMAEWVVRELREERPGVRLLVAGRIDLRDPARYGLRDLHERAARAGRGNIRSGSIWRMRDRILADTAFRATGDVYIRRWMVDPQSGAPRPTFRQKEYLGGVSYALPVYGIFE